MAPIWILTCCTHSYRSRHRRATARGTPQTSKPERPAVTVSRSTVEPQHSKPAAAPELGAERERALFTHMLRIRCLDERILKLQRAGRVGFAGSAKGLEGAIVGSAAALKPQDWLWSGLREGGAALMRGLPLAEYI